MKKNAVLHLIKEAARNKKTVLKLSVKQLTSLPPEIGQLTNLTELNLTGSQLTSLPPEIGQLTNLTELNLTGNQLTSLLPEIGQLTNLTELNLWRNQLTSLPPEIGQLTNLTELYLGGNQLTSLPPEIFQLKNLTGLYLFYNQLTSLPPEIFQLTNLTELNLSENQLTSLPPEIFQLTNLTELNLSENQLTSLPPEIVQLKNLTELDLSYNPLKSPPPEVVEKGTKAVLEFLRGVAESETTRFIAKLLLVGEGAVGKSSILRRLRGEEFDPNLETTHGIDVREYQLPHPDQKDIDITLNTWDFGGQQIYNATHQFFLTLRSVYLIVWSARSGMEQGRIEYWLETIKSLAPDSPVILVATFIDERNPDINFQALKARFPQLYANLSISNKTGKGLDELKRTVARAAADLPHMGKPWPKNWIDIEGAIKDCEEHNIDLKEYLSLCRNYNVTDEVAQGTLGDTLHFLGDILYYREDPVLSNMVVLKPNWITKAISLVLTNEIVKEKDGLLDHKSVPSIWSTYLPSLYPPFLRLMERFDLSFQIPTKEGFSLIPQLLPYEPPSLKPFPEAPAEGEPCLKMVYDLSFVPAGVMSWFIVRTHQYTTNKHWRDGVFLHYEDHYALVELSESARQISLEVWGSTPQNFFVVLMHSMDVILDRFPGLDIKRMIPCICHRLTGSAEPCIRSHPYEDLEELNRAGIAEVLCVQSKKMVSIPTMLYGIHPSTQEQILNELKELKKDTRKTLKDQMVQLTELSNRNFCRTYNQILEQDYRCPNVFLLKPKSRKRWNPKNLFSEPYVMQLYCQSHHGWHATTWEKEIDKPREWWLEFSPWLSRLIELMEFAVPMVKAVPHMDIPDDTFSEFQKNYDIMKEITNRLPEVVFSRDIDDMTRYKDSRPIEAVGPALRLLSNILHELDPLHEWGGLDHQITPDGNLLWLCPEHKEEYLSPALKM